jgi:hypothetical protein
MVTAHIDNPTVSVHLNKGESVSVPSGETWKVTVTMSLVNDDGEILLNGNGAFLGTQNRADGSSSHGGKTVWNGVVFESGDTIKFVDPATNGPRGCYLSGFVVDSN